VGRRLVEPLRAVYRPLLVLLAIAVLLRLLTMIAYSTVALDYYNGDATRYIRVGYSGMFEDPWQPAGYPLVLAGLRALTDWLPFTVLVQHVFGILTGLVLYATVRRAGGARPIALIPAALVFLSGDHLFMEQAFLMESPWMLLLALSLYASVRGAGSASARWFAGAGALLAVSALVRNLSLFLPLLLAFWAAFAVAGPWRARAKLAAAVVVPAAAVLVAYSLTATAIGSYSGMGEMSGWALYQRVAQFADCDEFKPPEGTRGLCETRPAGERPGPFYYYWDPSAPARRVMPGLGTEESDLVGDFARQAILHQPLDYTRTVVKDVVRYFDSNAGYDRPMSGSTLADMSFRTQPSSQPYADDFATRIRTRYDGLDATANDGTAVLADYQRVVRMNPVLLFVLLTLSGVAILLARGPQRALAVLSALYAAVLLVLPAAVASYDGRYQVPPAMLLAVAAAIGVAAVAQRLPFFAPQHVSARSTTDASRSRG
jgi:hypothetical protein